VCKEAICNGFIYNTSVLSQKPEVFGNVFESSLKTPLPLCKISLSRKDKGEIETKFDRAFGTRNYSVFPLSHLQGDW
jgi:hypothetical protein